MKNAVCPRENAINNRTRFCRTSFDVVKYFGFIHLCDHFFVFDGGNSCSTASRWKYAMRGIVEKTQKSEKEEREKNVTNAFGTAVKRLTASSCLAFFL
jgi:hypothetical protein